jgi:DNA-binding transcriptional regulator YdaS (Cro superfamily)
LYIQHKLLGMNTQTPFSRVGGTELAKALGCTKGLVSQWANGHRQVGAEWAVKIEEVTEGAIKRSELRPDLWPPDQPDLNPTPAAHAA